ncbi:MAG: helix-turn-helix domain-containing protein [Chitinispirillaceae bacterium]|nr:helix-turn-helix domain-containing protein [Chitinispirillaceae bacterium]
MEQVIEPELIDSRELARLLSVSVKFIEKHRQHIAGGMKIGGAWRFRLSDIRSRIATGRDVVVKNSR